jgi:hypothetical protein
MNLDKNGVILANTVASTTGLHGVVIHTAGSVERGDPLRAQASVPEQFSHLMPNDNKNLVLRSGSSLSTLAWVVKTFHENVDSRGWPAMIHEVVNVTGHYGWGLDIVAPITDADLDGIVVTRVVDNDYQPTRRRRVRSEKIDSRWGEKAIRSVYKDFIPKLKKFGRDIVLHDIKILTVTEFALRYGLPHRV